MPATDRSSTNRATRGYLFLSCSLGLFLGMGLLALTSCMTPTAADPYAPFRPALKPAFQSDLDELGPVPTYRISVTLSANTDSLRGDATIRVPNSSSDVWDYLVFRLYPMLEQYGGLMTVQNTNVAGRPTSFIYQPGTERTALRVSLPEPLRPGDHVDVRLAWQIDIPSWQDASGVYALFGKSQQMVSLPLFYPSLAVYQTDAELGAGTWWTDIGIVRGDAAFNTASLFMVTATLPADQIPVTSGTLVTSTLLNDAQARHTWVTGPAREFLLHSSPQFTSVYTEAYGTRVTSYWLPGDEAAGRAALQYTVAALRIFSDHYGAYPFRDLRVAPAPLSYRGMEYPQVSLVGVEAYSLYRSTLESLVAHEVAHQWWYQIVHNDPVNEPWLDEALAEYSIKLYTEALYGAGQADALRDTRWQARVDGLQDPSLVMDQPVADFSSGPVYEAIIYSKGALLYDSIRTTLGDRPFQQFLQEYLETHRYGIVDTADWMAALEARDSTIIDELDALQKSKYTERLQATPEGY